MKSPAEERTRTMDEHEADTRESYETPVLTEHGDWQLVTGSAGSGAAAG